MTYTTTPPSREARVAEADFEAALIAVGRAIDSGGLRVCLINNAGAPYTASALRVAFFRQCGIHDAIPLSPGVPFTDVQRRYIKNLKLLLDAWDAALVYESTPK